MSVYALPRWGVAPLVRAVRRLGLSARIIVLGLVLLIPTPVLLTAFISLTQSQIQFATRERAGLVVLAPTLQALTQVTAGRSPDLRAVTAAIATQPQLGLASTWRKIAGSAGSAGSVGSAGSAGSGVGDAKAFAAQLTQFITETGNASSLVLDPDLDSFYLMDALVVQLPNALVAATEASSSATGTTPVAVVTLAADAGVLGDAAASLARDIGYATSHTAAPDLATRLAPLQSVRQALTDRRVEILSSLQKPGALTGAQGADPTSGQPSRPTTNAVSSSAAKAVTPLVAALDQLLLARISTQRAHERLVLAIAAACALLGLWFAAAVVWTTRSDTNRTVSAAVALAANALTDPAASRALTGEDVDADGQGAQERDLRLPVIGHDEISRLAAAFNSVLDGIDAGRQQILDGQAERARIAMQGAERQRVADQTVRTRAQTVIDETASSVAIELNELKDQVDVVRQAANTIDARVTEADEATREVVTQAGSADQLVSDLMASLSQVNVMAEVIAGVADQTKLLALNATIEAARAGTAGRGFSVVANQVKELAGTTARSTLQITGTISALESRTSDVAAAIRAMGAGISRVDGATEMLRRVAHQQFSVVNQLEHRVNETVDRIDSMSNLTSRLERRQSTRVPVDGPVTIIVGGRRYDAMLVDLSEGGLKAQLPEGDILHTGQDAAVEFRLPEQTTLISAPVLVRKVDDFTRAAGFKFANPTPAMLTMLRDYVDEATGAVTFF